MNRRAVLVGVILAIVVAGWIAFPISRASAKDAPGCKGLGAYREEMFNAGRELNAKLAAQGIPATRDIITYSSSDWAAYAQDAGDYQIALKAITPPSFAKAWHQTKIEHTGLLQQIGLTVAKSGVLAINGFTTPIMVNAAATDAAVTTGSKTCADFVHFTVDYQALSGVNANGTPVATPAN
jgi:hypothetical protein